MRTNKRGCIVDRNDSGNLSLKIALGNDSDGKYKYQWISLGKITMTEAKKRLTETLRQLDTGTFIQPEKTTVSEYLTRWLQDYVTANCSPKTLEGYEIIINHHWIPVIGKYTLSQLKPEHLQKYYADKLSKGLSPTTIKHHHTVLHKSLQCAVEWQIITRNVADAVNPPRTKRIEMKTWNESEIKQFLETIKDTGYYQLFYLALFTGMRRSELLALRWQDIDLDYGQISVNRSLHVLAGGKVIFRQPKTAAGRRTIALPPSAILILSEYRKQKDIECLMLGTQLQDTDLVFNNLGKPMLSNSVSHAWNKLVKRSGVKQIRLHDSRHTHASIMLKQGVHPKVIQERLGHSSISTTLDVYSHTVPGMQALAAQRFDDVFKTSDNEKVKSFSSNLVANKKIKVTR